MGWLELVFPYGLKREVSKANASMPIILFLRAHGTFPAMMMPMNNRKSILSRGALVAAIFVAVCAPGPSSGQAPAEEQALAALVTEIAAQQVKIVANQQAIDQKLAVIEENIRLARIFVSRGGPSRR
jgi:hypothetical protein